MHYLVDDENASGPLINDVTSHILKYNLSFSRIKIFTKFIKIESIMMEVVFLYFSSDAGM